MEMFSNPKGLEAAEKTVSSGASMVRRHGELMWDAMCFRFEGFTPREIIKELIAKTGCSPFSAHSRFHAFVAYCFAAPEDFSGPASKLVRVRHGRYTLQDN